MTRVKICGIRDKIQALAAVEAGADFIGLVFAPSQRQVSPAQARKIASAVRESGHPDYIGTEVVGVFANMSASEVNETADYCALDWVQLSGDESWEYCRRINRPVIKTVRVSQQSLPELDNVLSAGTKLLGKQNLIILLDTHVEGKYGGTGKGFDWNLAQQLAKKFPIMVAGGLSPQNVAQLIQKVKPWGVDVSSGVESRGVKDTAKIKAFIEAVRKADEKRQTTT